MNRNRLIDNWPNHTVVENRGAVVLMAGVEYEIEIEYCDIVGAASMKLYWSADYLKREIVPISQLVPVVLPEFLVKRINFNTQAGRTVWSDAGTEYKLEQWKDTGKADGNPDGLKLDEKGDGNTHFRNPVLFSTDTELTIEEVVLSPDIVIPAGSNASVGNYRLVGNLTVTNSGTVQTVRLESTEGSVTGTDWKFVNLKAVINGTNGTKLTSVGYDPNAKITWWLVLKDLGTRTDNPLGSVIQAGQTRNPTYVTFQKINTTKTPTFRALESFLRWGCGNAAAGAPTEASVVAAVWAAFSGRMLKDVDNKDIVYYATWSVKSDNTNSVVNRSVVQSLLYDVNCVTLTMYMVSALRAQGLEYSENVLIVKGKLVTTVVQKFDNRVITLSPARHEVIFVKEWQQKPENGKTTTYNGYEWTNTFLGATPYKINNDTGVWNYAWVKEEIGKEQDQLPGQNNKNPLAIFNDHFMVQLKIGSAATQLYDPSYGVIYSDLADFETRIAYFSVYENKTVAIRTNGAGVDLQSLNKRY